MSFYRAVALSLTVWLLASPADAQVSASCRKFLGTWQFTSLGITTRVDINADGSLVMDGGSRFTWSCSGNQLNYSGGEPWRLSPDGKRMSGSGMAGAGIAGTRIAGPSKAVIVTAPAGKHVARGKSPYAQQCAAIWPQYLSQAIADGEELDEPLGPAQIEREHRHFLDLCLTEGPGAADIQTMLH